MERGNWYYRKLLKNFWEKVDIKGEDECWEWKATISKTTGYGHAYNGNESIPAYRMSWIITYGEIPKLINGRKTVIRHLCGNKICVNPIHLSIGNYGDIARDAHREGKKVKLSLEDIKKIRFLRTEGKTYYEIRYIFKRLGRDINKDTIRKAYLGKTGIYKELNMLLSFEESDRLKNKQSK